MCMVGGTERGALCLPWKCSPTEPHELPLLRLLQTFVFTFIFIQCLNNNFLSGKGKGGRGGYERSEYGQRALNT